MIEDEKAAPDAGTSRGGGENGCWQAPEVPLMNLTTATGREQGQIERLLPHGEENAIPTAALVQLAGAKTSRSPQGRIEAERQAGALILSTTKGGYFLPDAGEKGKQEINAYVRTLRARALNTLRTLRAARAALEQIDGQQEMEV